MKIDNYIIQSSPGFFTNNGGHRGESPYRGDLSGIIEKNKLQINALRHPQIQSEPVYRNNFYAPPVYDLPTKINQVSTYNKGLPSTYNQQYRADLQFGRPVNKLSKDTSYDILNINKPLTYPEDTFIPLKTLNSNTPAFKIPKNTAPLSDGVESLVVRYNQNINNFVQSITNETGFNYDYTELINRETFLLNRQHFSDYKKFWTKIFASTTGNILFYTYGNPTLLAYLSFYPELNHKKQTIYYYDKTDITTNVQEELFGTRFPEALHTSKYNTVIADITLESKTSADDLLDVFSREEKLYIITTRQMYNDPEDKRTPKPLESMPTDATDEHQPAERRYSDEYTDEPTLALLETGNTPLMGVPSKSLPINFDEYNPDAYPTGDSSDPAEAAPINPDTHSAIFQSSHDLSDYPGDSEYTDEQKQELLNYGSIDPLASQLPYIPPSTEEQADTQQVISENIQQTPNYQQELNQLNLAKQEEERQNLIRQVATNATDDVLDEALVDTKQRFDQQVYNQITDLNNKYGIALFDDDEFMKTLRDLMKHGTQESVVNYIVDTAMKKTTMQVDEVAQELVDNPEVAQELVDNPEVAQELVDNPEVAQETPPVGEVPPELVVTAESIDKELTDLKDVVNEMPRKKLLKKVRNLRTEIQKEHRPILNKKLTEMSDEELRKTIEEYAIIIAELKGKPKQSDQELVTDRYKAIVEDSLHSNHTYEKAIVEDKVLPEKEKSTLRKFMPKFYKENIEFEKSVVDSYSDLNTSDYYMIGTKFYTIVGNGQDEHFINNKGERIDFTEVRYDSKENSKYPQVFKLKKMEVTNRHKTPDTSIAKRSDIFPNWYNASEYAIKNGLYKRLPEDVGELNRKELWLFSDVWNRYNTTGSGYHKARLHKMHLLGGKIIKNGNRIYHLLPYDPRTNNKRKYPVGVGVTGGAIEKFQKKRQLQDRGQMVVLNGFVSNVFEL